MSEFVSWSWPRVISAPIGRISSPVGSTATTGLRRTTTSVTPGGAAGGHVDRAQSMTLGKEELGGADVLADRADVLVRHDGRPQLGPVLDIVDVLAHDDGVESIGKGIPGVDHLEGAGGEQDRSVSLAPIVSEARTAMPSMAEASNGGDDRTAHTGSGR